MVGDADYSLLMCKLEKLQSAIDRLEKDFNTIKNTQKPLWQKATETQFGGQIQTKSSCLWENLSPEDRMKPMSMSCPCIKCSTYCLSLGSLTDAGYKQMWRESLSDSQDVEE